MQRIIQLVVVTVFIALLGTQVWADQFTHEDAKELTIKAATLIEKVGIDKAREILHDPNGDFIKGEKGELYVSIVNFDGVWLAYPPRPAGVGKCVLNVKDADGVYLVKELIATARDKGEGWVKYRWLDPKSGKIKPKVAFVKRVGNKDMYASAGIYK